MRQNYLLIKLKKIHIIFDILVILLVEQFQIILLHMDKTKKLEGEPFMEQIRKIIKPKYMAEIQDAIQQEDQQQLLGLLRKYLRKTEAQEYYPKILNSLRKYKLSKRSKTVDPNSFDINQYIWSKQKIVAYLKQRLSSSQLQLVCQCIQAGNQDLCNTLLSDFLRYDQAQEIKPHILSLYKIQSDKQSNRSKSLAIQDKDTNIQELQVKIIKGKKKNLTQYIPHKNNEKQLISMRSQIEQPFIYQNVDDVQLNFNGIISNMLNKTQYKKQQRVFGKDKKIEEKNLNPQKREQYNKNIIDIIKQIRLESQVKKNKEKIQLIEQLKNQFGQQQNQLFEQVKQLLNKGKIKKGEQRIRSVLSKKQTQNYMKRIRQIFTQKTNMPLQNSIFVKQNQDGIKFYELQTQQILDIPEDDITNVLIVGMTGVGKSTYLNALVNYFMNTEMEDNFRYIVSGDMFKNQNGKSSTEKVKFYGIPKQGRMKKAIRLIDIPGLGDTGGITKDRQNLRMIHERIQQNVPYINLIIYIFKSSQTRITKQTQYVIGQIMGLFAKDIGSNILFVLTFADNQQPNVLNSLKSSFADIIERIKQNNKEWFVKVNNSALFKKIDLKNPIDTSFYTMGFKCLQKTAQIMDKYLKVSTKMSLQVMESREQIQLAIQGLHEQISISLIKQQIIRDLAQKISNNKLAIQGLQYKIKVKEQKFQIDKVQNIVTTCLNCKFTCHRICTRKNQDKNKCKVMKNGKCTICPDRCGWQTHINDNQLIRRVIVQVQKTIEEIYNKYKIQQQNKNKNENLLLTLIGQYSQVLVKLKGLCQKLKQLNEKLSQIELKKINHATVVEYIQILIANQQNQKLEGYLNRIKQLQAIKNYQIRLQSILKENQNSQFEKFQDLMKNRIDQLITQKDVAQNLLNTVMKSYQQIKISKQDIQMIKNQEMVSSQGP